MSCTLRISSNRPEKSLNAIFVIFDKSKLIQKNPLTMKENGFERRILKLYRLRGIVSISPN